MAIYLPSEASVQNRAMIFCPTYESYNNKNNYSGKSFYDTWESWRMIPTSDPYIPASQVLTNYTDFEYWDGALDESEVLEDKTYRQMINGECEFLVDFSYTDKFNSIYDLYTDILEAIHGQEKILLFATDLLIMYKGRVYIDEFDDPGDGTNCKVSIEFNVEPFLYNANETNFNNYLNTGNKVIEQMG